MDKTVNTIVVTIKASARPSGSMGSNTVVVRSFAMAAALHSENSRSVKATRTIRTIAFNCQEGTRPSLYEGACQRGFFPVEPLRPPFWNLCFPSRGGNFKSETSDDPIREKAADQQPAKPWSCRTLSACILWGERGGMFCLGVWLAGVQERNLFPAELFLAKSYFTFQNSAKCYQVTTTCR